MYNTITGTGANMNIVGRDQEQKELSHVLETNDPAFLVIYGRRRVGKTYLIKNFFRN